MHAWTDSTIVLNWLTDNQRRFKTYRVSCIMELMPPDKWNHVSGIENPVSRGLFPSKLLEHSLWWNGPEWFQLESSKWPKQDLLSPNAPLDEEGEVSLQSITLKPTSIIHWTIILPIPGSNMLLPGFSGSLITVSLAKGESHESPVLTVQELKSAMRYWLLFSQRDSFAKDVKTIEEGREVAWSSSLLPLHPFLDSSSLLRVGGRQLNSKLPYYNQHPVIVYGKHPL